tara:strand:+ start:121 stop:441 length:321 start_codon:yes stop_codon:yes gene_type:complete
MTKLKIEKIIAPLSLTSPVTSSRFFVLGFLASILLSIIRFIAIPYVRIAEIAIIKTIKSNILNPILSRINRYADKPKGRANTVCSNLINLEYEVIFVYKIDMFLLS